LEFDDLSRKVIGCAIEVHRNLGPGLLESVYRHGMAFELNAQGIGFESEKLVPIRYKQDERVGDLRLDLLVERELIVELKAVEGLSPVHEAQLLTYMKLAGVHTGLLINFNSRFLRDGLKRFVR
jgi:GxxExxY protein